MLPVAPLGPAEAYSVASRTKANVAYMVVRLVGNQWRCTCPARKVCVHIRSVEQYEERRAARSRLTVVRSEA